MSKILFIRGGAIGDFILTLPAIQLVRSTLPKTRVEVLGYESITSLAKAASLADETRSIEHGPMAGFFVPGGKLDQQWMDYFGSFSVVISYLYDSDGFFRENVERCQVDTFIQGPHRIDESLQDQSAAAQLAKPLESLAMYLEQPFVEFPDEMKVSQDEQSAEMEGAQGRPRIALHPGSGSPSKNWSLEGWVEVAKSLQQKFPGAEWMIISGEAEERSIDDCLSLLDVAQIPYRHLNHLSLPSLATVLRSCDLFLGHDSGISHLAGSCGMPAVLLFGPTDPKIWAPQNPGVNVVSAEAGDLSRIEANEVVEKAVSVLTGV